MNQLETLKKAILLDPSDALVRLAYADELETVGGPRNIVKALIIRGGWGNSKIPREQFCGIPEACYGLQNEPEAEMIFAIGATVTLDGNKIRMGGGETSTIIHYISGFISHVEMNTVDFLKYAEYLFSQHPITSVRLLDKRPITTEPHPSGSVITRWWSRRDDRQSNDFYELPEEIFPFLLPDYDCTRVEDYDDEKGGFREYRKEEHAIKGCSKACVRFGRNLAGLPTEW